MIGEIFMTTSRFIVLVITGFIVGVGFSLLNGCTSLPNDEALTTQERQVVEDVRYGLEL